LVYLLYLAGLIYFYFTAIRHIGSEKPDAWLIQNSTKEGLSMVSMVAMAYLFFILCVDPK
jgi:hypothetical protein